MPTLPTLTVTANQATRLLAVFSGKTDEQGNSLTPTQAYKRWLRDTLVAKVRDSEVSNLQTSQLSATQSLIDDVNNSLVIDPTV